MNDSKVVAVQGVARDASSYGMPELNRMATTMFKSGFFPVKSEEEAMALLLIAQAEGIHPAQAMQDYDVIQKKPALKSAAMLARFQRSGGKVQWLTSTDECVEGKFSHPAGGELIVKWDTARIKTAGLAEKDMHRKFPQQMKRARCISEAIRAIAPQSIPVGMYTVEETRDMPLDILPVSENQAIAEAVEQVQSEVPRDAVDVLIDSMDVPTLPELSAAFESAWKATKGDTKARARIKSAYDMMKTALETPTEPQK
jgi:hypothetical protein